jgi:hypothetical protein
MRIFGKIGIAPAVRAMPQVNAARSVCRSLRTHENSPCARGRSGVVRRES